MNTKERPLCKSCFSTPRKTCERTKTAILVVLLIILLWLLLPPFIASFLIFFPPLLWPFVPVFAIPVALRALGVKGFKNHGCVLAVLLLFACMTCGGLYWLRSFVPRVQYASESIPLLGYVRTQFALYEHEHARLPFADSDLGSVTTWRRTNKKESYEPIWYCCGELVTNAVNPTNTCLFRMEIPLSKLEGKNISADQIQIACLAPGGSSNNGTTNGYAYAVGCFGNGRGYPVRTGVAVLDAYFPDVEVHRRGSLDRMEVNSGYRLVVWWENYNGRGSVKNAQIRFGLEPEPGVCMLIPPEAFKPGAVTKLRGDGPDSVEYWVERLRSAPCGKWEIPDFGP